MSAYTRIPAATLANLQLRGRWVLVEEHLAEQVHGSGLVVLEKQATTLGRVWLVGVEVSELQPGDEIMYTAWQGGRWELGDGFKGLFMQEDDVLVRFTRVDE